MPSESLANVSSEHNGTSRSTCPKCHHTVVVVEIDGRKLVTDTEVIAVVPERDPKGRGRTGRLTARRLHAESCATLAKKASTGKLDKERKRYGELERARLARAPENIGRVMAQLQDQYVEAAGALRKFKRMIDEAAAPLRKRARTKGM